MQYPLLSVKQSGIFITSVYFERLFLLCSSTHYNCLLIDKRNIFFLFPMSVPKWIYLIDLQYFKYIYYLNYIPHF